MVTRVRRNADHSRYDLFVDGELAGIADYRLAEDGVTVFPHTEVDAARRGQGLGAALVQAALDDVRARGGTVEPRCEFVAHFIDDHPEYRDLL